MVDDKRRMGCGLNGHTSASDRVGFQHGLPSQGAKMKNLNQQIGQRNLDEVIAQYGVSRTDLLRGSKSPRHVEPRQELWFRLTIIEGFSLTRAARLCGAQFHHTTVLHGVRSLAVRALGTSPKATLAEIRAAWEAQQMGVAA